MDYDLGRIAKDGGAPDREGGDPILAMDGFAKGFIFEW